MSKKIKKLLVSLLMFVGFCFGISLQIKADVGQSMLNAFVLTLTTVFHLKVGTMLNIVNGCLWCVNIAARKFKITVLEWVQILFTMLNGLVVNFFVYTVLGGWTLEGYWPRLALFVFGIFVSSINLGMMLAIGIVKFPMEGFCMTLSGLLGKKLTMVRYSMDVFFLATILVTVLVFKTPLFVREGTVLSFFLLSLIMGKSYQWFSKNSLAQ